jgi:carbon-monoxide dehydrogenase catalytic subunit
VREIYLDKKLLAKAKKEKLSLYTDRFSQQQPQCSFGLSGACCKNCLQGPCRIIGKKAPAGICGATSSTIVARNLVRMAAAGTTCHTDHAREAVLTLLKVSQNKTKAYKIRDEQKLKDIAEKLGFSPWKNIHLLAKEVSEEALEDFRRQEGLYHKKEGDYLNWLKITVPMEKIHLWKKLNLLPVNCDMETSHALHQTTLGNDAEPSNLLLSFLRLGITDGYAGLHLATDMQDILFGTPTLTKTTCNLGTLKEDYVNIIVHGHVPLLSEKILEWAKKLNHKAKRYKAKGINVVGMCCTGQEILMRLGIPIAGHILQQELAVITGAADSVVVDIQCIFPSLGVLANCYHTKLITTIDYVKIPGAVHVPFTIENADNAAKKIIEISLQAYKKRNPKKIQIPKKTSDVYGGFSVELIKKLISLKQLFTALKNREIRGIVAVAGCRTAKLNQQPFHEELMKLLIKNDILVVATGCSAHAAAQHGLMTPEAAENLAGAKLKSFLKKISKNNNLNFTLPPVWHMGSCVDSSRVATLFIQLSKESGTPIENLPIAVSAPELATEKCVAIGTYFLALGVTTHINPPLPTASSPYITSFLSRNLEALTHSKVLTATTPKEALNLITQTLNKKRF